MATENKIKIWIRIANLRPLELSVNPSDEPLFRRAEKNVNSLWNQWMTSFGGNRSSEEVMAMVAFQFARLYLQCYEENVAVNEMLTSFEQRLDEIVIKSKE